MRKLIQSLLSKSAYDNGWEIFDGNQTFSSSRHPGVIGVTEIGQTLEIIFIGEPKDLLIEHFPDLAVGDALHLPFENGAAFHKIEPRLSEIFKCAALQAQPCNQTECETRIKARLGQQKYREGLFDIWDNACDVTGLSIPSLLRASHAKPWKVATDAERLDPYNGFLLSPDMDALFDSGLITFSDDGQMLHSPHLPDAARQALNLDRYTRLRLPPHPRHLPYLAYHRGHVFGR